MKFWNVSELNNVCVQYICSVLFLYIFQKKIYNISSNDTWLIFFWIQILAINSNKFLNFKFYYQDFIPCLLNCNNDQNS